MKSKLKMNVTFLTFIMVFAFTAGGIVAQTDTDSPETPVVISRDKSVVEKPVKLLKTDVRESTDSSKERTVAPSREIIMPRNVASPYNIKISEAQQKMILYLDILTKTETRAETLRSKLFEMIEKENSVRDRIRQIDYRMRPEQIQNAAALSGSLRPENIRSERLRILQSEKRNMESLLDQIQVSRRNLENAITGADRLVQRVRTKFEAFVDAALEEGSEF